MASMWLPIKSAPMWMGDNQALVGQINSDRRWAKVSLWDAAWNRDAMIHRGATHYLKLPDAPTEKDDVIHLTLMFG